MTDQTTYSAPCAEPEVIIAAADADVFGGREDVKLMVEGERFRASPHIHEICKVSVL
jgi:hypothetical protein